MRRQGSGFGLVMLVVVLAVVLFLATRAFRSTLPAARALATPSGEAAGATAGATPTDAPPGDQSVRPSRLPDLRDVKKGTDTHAAQVRDAVEKSQD